MSEHIEFLKEVFEEFGPIRPRRMFGGYRLFYKGLTFIRLMYGGVLWSGIKASTSHEDLRFIGKLHHALTPLLTYAACRPPGGLRLPQLEAAIRSLIRRFRNHPTPATRNRHALPSYHREYAG